MVKNPEPVVSSVPTPPSSLVEVDKVRIWSHGRSLDTIEVGADFLSVPRKIKPRMIGFPFTPQLSIVTPRGPEGQSTRAPKHQSTRLTCWEESTNRRRSHPACWITNLRMADDTTPIKQDRILYPTMRFVPPIPPAVRHNVAWFSRVPHRAASTFLLLDPDTIPIRSRFRFRYETDFMGLDRPSWSESTSNIMSSCSLPAAICTLRLWSAL